MINLDRLYEKAPHLAPKGYKHPTRLYMRSKARHSSVFEVENSFRNKLLQNLEYFRNYRSSISKCKEYICPLRRTFPRSKTSFSSPSTHHNLLSF